MSTGSGADQFAIPYWLWHCYSRIGTSATAVAVRPMLEGGSDGLHAVVRAGAGGIAPVHSSGRSTRHTPGWRQQNGRRSAACHEEGVSAGAATIERARTAKSRCRAVAGAVLRKEGAGSSPSRRIRSCWRAPCARRHFRSSCKGGALQVFSFAARKSGKPGASGRVCVSAAGSACTASPRFSAGAEVQSKSTGAAIDYCITRTGEARSRTGAVMAPLNRGNGGSPRAAAAIACRARQRRTASREAVTGASDRVRAPAARRCRVGAAAARPGAAAIACSRNRWWTRIRTGGACGVQRCRLHEV